MSGDSSYRVEVKYAPENKRDSDTQPYRARIYLGGDDFAPVYVAWGRTSETALQHARQWVKQQNTHGPTAQFFLDASGDLITEPDGHSVKVRA